MNRNIKKIIAVALTLNTLNAVIPATNFNLLNTKVYAATGDLSSIKLRNSNGRTIQVYSDDDYKSRNEVDYDGMDDKGIYYAKTSSDEIKISTSGISSNRVRIFKGRSSSTKGIKTSNNIYLVQGSITTLTIRTYSDDPGIVRYDNDSYVSEYTIKVKCTASSSNSDEEENGDVYLRNLYLSNGEINFSKSTSTYNVNVAESISVTTITAKPDCDSDDYDDYEVKINGTTVDKYDKFKKDVYLNKGNNEVKITVEDSNGERRLYTLNITRAQAIPVVKANQWVIVNGKWQYNDSLGTPLKNTWFYDRNYGKSYYLQSDGNMATGWLYYGGTWYFLGNDGAKKTGWQLVSGNWYYLDYEGRMLTGWIKDVDGRYYYLYSNGAMAYNTIISGYKLGYNGAWIR